MTITTRSIIIGSIALALIASAIISAPVARADHSWAGYHWARTTNTFTLKLGDNLVPTWDQYLTEAQADWNPSQVLDTNIVGGTAGKNCKATAGMVQVCNSKYGNNGWLGIAQIWISGTHITAGTVKLNDYYFSTTKYNTPDWKGLVMCQEVAHTFGLDHQDEIFTNVNLGTCMDYTNAPAGGAVGTFNYGPSNRYPNAHDFEQLALIYAHVDTSSTLSQTSLSNAALDNDSNDPHAWGKEIHRSPDGHSSVFEQDLGGGVKTLRHVYWVEGRNMHEHE